MRGESVSAALETVFAVLALAAVWFVSALDVRGQYLVLVERPWWTAFSTLGERWWLLVQSVVLIVLTLQAIIKWGKAARHRVMGLG